MQNFTVIVMMIKTLLALLILIPSLGKAVFEDEEIIIKCVPDFYFDMNKDEEIDVPVESRIIQVLLYEPVTTLIEVQHTNGRRWEGTYTLDSFYANYEDEKDNVFVIDFNIEINRLTGKYTLNRYLYVPEDKENFMWVESGYCEKYSKLF